MGFLCSAPNPPTAVTTAQQDHDLPVPFQEALYSLIGRSSQIAAEPYQPYGGQQLATLTPDQQQAYELTRQGIGAYAPYLQTAGQTFPQANMAAYMNPFQQAVTDINQRNLIRNYQMTTAPQLDAAAVGAGGFGGSRHALLQAESARNLNKQLADMQQQDAYANWAQAQQAFNLDRTNAATMAGLAQQMPLRDAAALSAIGADQQAQEQRNLDIARQQFERQQAYPSQQAAFMSNIIRGLPFNSLTSTTTQQAAPGVAQASPLAQAGGAGLAALGFLGGTGAFGTAANPGYLRAMFAEGGAVKYAGGGSVDGVLTSLLRHLLEKRAEQTEPDGIQYFQSGGPAFNDEAPLQDLPDRVNRLMDSIFDSNLDPSVRDEARNLYDQYQDIQTSRRISEGTRRELAADWEDKLRYFDYNRRRRLAPGEAEQGEELLRAHGGPIHYQEGGYVERQNLTQRQLLADQPTSELLRILAGKSVMSGEISPTIVESELASRSDRPRSLFEVAREKASRFMRPKSSDIKGGLPDEMPAVDPDAISYFPRLRSAPMGGIGGETSSMGDVTPARLPVPEVSRWREEAPGEGAWTPQPSEQLTTQTLPPPRTSTPHGGTKASGLSGTPQASTPVEWTPLVEAATGDLPTPRPEAAVAPTSATPSAASEDSWDRYLPLIAAGARMMQADPGKSALQMAGAGLEAGAKTARENKEEARKQRLMALQEREIGTKEQTARSTEEYYKETARYRNEMARIAGEQHKLDASKRDPNSLEYKAMQAKIDEDKARAVFHLEQADALRRAPDEVVGGLEVLNGRVYQRTKSGRPVPFIDPETGKIMEAAKLKPEKSVAERRHEIERSLMEAESKAMQPWSEEVYENRRRRQYELEGIPYILPKSGKPNPENLVIRGR